MTFSARAAVVAGLVLAGCRDRAGGSPSDSGCPGELVAHDHRPHHGGMVGMVGDFHLEVVAESGRIRVYVTDVCRAPLPPPERGTVVVEGEAGAGAPVERPLVARGAEYLEGDDAATPRPYLATIRMRLGSFDIDMAFPFAATGGDR